MRFEISDDSGFLAIVDPDAYRGFVRADWTLEILVEHFLGQMRERHLLIWGTGLAHMWRIAVSQQPTTVAGFRETIGSVAASRGRLLLTNYESLTMAAQFHGVSLPQRHEQQQIVQMDPALYDCRIIQLSDPKTDAPFEEPVSFVCELTLAASPREAWRSIPWAVF